MSESKIAATIRLAAAEDRAALLMRNNSGALPDGQGRWIRFGLGNDSKAVNERLKSSDLVGIRPVLIQPHHVGTVIGQFFALETKEPAWRGPAGSQRATAQAAWIDLIRSWGGVGGFASSVEMARALWSEGK